MEIFFYFVFQNIVFMASKILLCGGGITGQSPCDGLIGEVQFGAGMMYTVVTTWVGCFAGVLGSS